jgi:hypothetical protein
MDRYFDGRKLVGSLKPLIRSGRDRIDVKIHERWEPITTSTARCGNDQSYSAQHTVGLSEKASLSFKAALESTIGIKDVLGLKSNIEQTTGLELNWTESQTITQTFSLKPPPCGRCTQVIYQLARTYEFTYWQKGWFRWRDDDWTRKWTHSLVEWTRSYESVQDIEHDDRSCRCDPPPTGPKFDGRLSFDLGSFGFRAPYRADETHCHVETGGRPFSIKVGASAVSVAGWGVRTRLERRWIPEALLFLAREDQGPFEAVVTKVQETVDSESRLQGSEAPAFAEEAVSAAPAREYGQLGEA